MHEAEVARLRPVVAGRLRLFAVLLFAAMLTARLALPFALAGIAFAGMAVVQALRCLMLMAGLHRGGVRIGGRIAVSLGLGVAVVLMLVLLVEAAFYPIFKADEQCRAGAVTGQARAKCAQEHQQRIDDLLRKVTVSPGSG